jgi:hypothetical protein
VRIISDVFEGADIACNWKRRARLDLFFAVAVFLLMLDRLTGNPFHEIFSLAAVCAAALHLLVNRAWFGRILCPAPGKKRPAAFRAFLNFLLLLAGAGSVVSGLMLSQTLISAVTPLAWQSDLELRAANVTWSFAFFALSAVHAGLHWEAWLTTLGLSKRLITGGSAVLCALALFALRGIAERRELDFIFTSEMAYIPVDQEEAVFLMPLDLLSLWLLAAAAVYLLLLPFRR